MPLGVRSLRLPPVVLSTADTDATGSGRRSTVGGAGRGKRHGEPVRDSRVLVDQRTETITGHDFQRNVKHESKAAASGTGTSGRLVNLRRTRVIDVPIATPLVDRESDVPIKRTEDGAAGRVVKHDRVKDVERAVLRERHRSRVTRGGAFNEHVDTAKVSVTVEVVVLELLSTGVKGQRLVILKVFHGLHTRAEGALWGRSLLTALLRRGSRLRVASHSHLLWLVLVSGAF